jgi:predicted PurR-regulated permease PerM
MIVGKASKLHTLIMFFSVIGGIEFLGLIGIVAGPLVVALAATLLETYRSEEAEPAPKHSRKARRHNAGVGSKECIRVGWLNR